jgi:hypothetical protein
VKGIQGAIRPEHPMVESITGVMTLSLAFISRISRTIAGTAAICEFITRIS